MTKTSHRGGHRPYRARFLATGLACAAISLTLAFEWKVRRMIKLERKVRRRNSQ